MNNMNITTVLSLLKELENHLKLHGNDSIVFQLKTIQSAIEVLESDCSLEEKESCIVESYKLLYPTRGGLSEFYIWDKDFERRKELNEPLERISDSLWKIVKDKL